MAANAKPKGAVPEKHGHPLDVKDQTEDTSASEDTKPQTFEKEDIRVEVQTSPEAESDPALDEADLETFEKDSKRIPYSRFKEVNQKAKDLETQLKERDDRFSEELRKQVELAELRLRNQMKREQEIALEEEGLDPQEKRMNRLEKEIHSLRDENRHLRNETNSKLMQDQVTRLEKIYPKRVVLAALGLKKHDSSINLEEACEDFSAEIDDQANQKLRSIIEKKKQKARVVLPTRETGIRLKETEKPKTIAEAKAAVKKLFGR